MDPNNYQPTQPSPYPDTPPVPFNHHLPLHGTPDRPQQPQTHYTPTQNNTAPTVPEPARQPVATVNNISTPTASESNSFTIADRQEDRPVPVVRVLSVRGVEYAMMSIFLWFWAGSLITILVSLIMGGSGFSELAFPVSLMVIAVPGFSFFYLRLRKAELRIPSLRLDASKRRFSQITQIVAFLTCFFNLVALAYVIISLAGGSTTRSLGKFVGATAVTLLVAGSILAYYWFDEHKLVK